MYYYQTHAADLAVVHGLLWEAVPQAYRTCSDFGSPQELAGGTLGTMVREYVHLGAKRLQEPGLKTLTLSSGRNRSVVLGDNRGVAVRVRKQPIDWKRRTLVALPMLGQELLLPDEEQLSLFANETPAGGQGITVLWKPNPRKVELSRAVLALVHDIENSSKTRVLDFVDLPDPKVDMLGGVQVPSQPEPGDYEEFFGDASGIIGPDSA